MMKRDSIENFQDYASRIMKRAAYTDYMSLGKKNLMNPSQNFRPLGIFNQPIEKAVSIINHLRLRAQSFTSLMGDIHQDINGGFAFSRCLKGMFP